MEVVERDQIDSLPFPLVSSELWMILKENPARKKWAPAYKATWSIGQVVLRDHVTK